MLFRFSLYAFLENQQYYDLFLILALLQKDLRSLQIGILISFRPYTFAPTCTRLVRMPFTVSRHHLSPRAAGTPSSVSRRATPQPRAGARIWRSPLVANLAAVTHGIRRPGGYSACVNRSVRGGGGYWQRWVTMPDLVAGLCEAIPPVPPVGVLFGEIEPHGRLPVVLGI